MPLHVSSTCAHHQEVKIALHSLWYRHTYRSKLYYTASGLITPIGQNCITQPLVSSHLQVKIALHSLWYRHTYRSKLHYTASGLITPIGQNCITQPLVSSHLQVKIALHILWYHHTYRCDDTRGCIMQFWPPDDEHMCSKHVEAWNKLILKQNFVHQVG